VAELEGVAGGAFLGSVRYRRNSGSPPQVNETSFGFETGGGMTHIVASLATVNAYGTGATTADNGKLIGASSEGVEGTEIVTPVYQWHETKWFDPSAVTKTFKGNPYALTGRTNNAAFKGTEAGETLFLGASGSQRGTDPWEINFSFASAPNKTGLTIGDITGIAKKGWEYLWVRYKPKELTGTLKIVTQKPAAVYVERVYDEGDFALLGIGT